MRDKLYLQPTEGTINAPEEDWLGLLQPSQEEESHQVGQRILHENLLSRSQDSRTNDDSDLWSIADRDRT